MCSGTDVMCKAARTMFAELNRLDGLEANYVFAHRFSTEISVPAQQWIRKFVKPQYSFNDVGRLKDGFMQDLLSERVAPVAGAGWIGSGFSCKDVSEMNMSASDSKGCIGTGSLGTGGTFAGTMDYVDIVRPRVVFLENVAAIEEGGQNRG